MVELCTKCGLRPKQRIWCKECVSEYNKSYREKYKLKIHEQRAQHRQRDRELIREQKKLWYRSPTGQLSYQQRKLSGRMKESDRRYRQNHPDKIRAKNSRQYPRYRRSIQQKLRRNLRNRLWYALKGERKVGSAVRDLGCSIDFLKKHLESKFQPGMSWDNYGVGNNKWSVDHITPISLFDLTDRKQLLKACNYVNLQPLWSSDNSRKRDSMGI